MLVPIIMESEIEKVEEKVMILLSRSERRVQIDIGDGLYSEMWSISPADLQQINLQGLEFEFHLLVDDPMEWVAECVALSPKKIIAQIEHMGSQSLFLAEIESYAQGVDGGLALAINTPIEALEKDALELAKTILLMAVPVGTSGSPFDVKVLSKITELSKVYKGKIVVDGGINPETAKMCYEAGAHEVLANSAYWRGEWK